MSSKTRNHRKHAASETHVVPILRSVPDQVVATKVRTDTEDKLWTALHANPNSTTAELASTATIGKSTAGKILVKWCKEGSVMRTPGIAEGGRRSADLWTVVDTSAAGHTSTVDTDSVDPALAEASASEPLNSEDESPSESTHAGADHAPDAADTGATDTVEPVVTEVTTSAAITGAAGGDAAPDDMHKNDAGDKATRLAPGTLRGMVEDYLRDHPGEEFGPVAIAKDLGGKSSGAVSNALDKLVVDGTAVKTKESPKRFALAPAEQAAAAVATQ